MLFYIQNEEGATINRYYLEEFCADIENGTPYMLDKISCICEKENNTAVIYEPPMYQYILTTVGLYDILQDIFNSSNIFLK